MIPCGDFPQTLKAMQICLTVDAEPDCPPYLNTFRGIEEGLPALLALLDGENIRATFFVTGQVARQYPARVEQIVSREHELGSRGDTHTDFTALSPEQADAEIERSATTLRQFAPVTAFRAPYLKFPAAYLRLLEAHGFLVDSSQARYKLSRPQRPDLIRTRLIRRPVSATSSVLRLPDFIPGNSLT
jgi:peptidoglycan-N-acetylglucosamine deacetylase